MGRWYIPPEDTPQLGRVVRELLVEAWRITMMPVKKEWDRGIGFGQHHLK